MSCKSCNFTPRQPIPYPMKKTAILSFVSLFLMLACKDINTTHTPMNHTPPTVDKIAKNIETHGDAREDGYYWLNEIHMFGLNIN